MVQKRPGNESAIKVPMRGVKLTVPPKLGIVIERIQASLSMEMKEKKTIIYLGDGLGDFCRSLKLADGDYLMPRKNFSVWDLDFYFIF
ncbi:hypothetical protein CRYUN_Cryun21dG0109200 [Craigia yunnanensis]